MPLSIEKFELSVALGKSRSDCGPENIDTLVRIIRELVNVPGDIAEFGSYRGGSTIAMAAAALYYPSDPIKHVYAFDVFGGLPYGEEAPFQNFAGTDFDEIKSVYALYPNITAIRGAHEVTVPILEYRPLSLIFMDSDFESSHKVCLNKLWPWLSPGGCVLFHDWAFEGVQRAIDEFFTAEKKAECCYFGRLQTESQNIGMIQKNA